MTDQNFYSYLFDEFDPKTYAQESGLADLFDVDATNLDEALKQIKKGVYDSVTPETKKPVELDDLTRLHYLVTSRKATTILEFGLGNSTQALAHALLQNKGDHEAFVSENLRRTNPFELHSVDNMQQWIDVCDERMPEQLKSVAHLQNCPVHVSDFCGRLCTYYHDLPNICPDFIYLDGPHLYSAEGTLRGLTTAHRDRMPMAADILTLEHFLLPGTLIVTDGRTANARFLKCNFQRNWRYLYVEEFDQHFFELHEQPLGKINKAHIDFCLSPSYFDGL